MPKKITNPLRAGLPSKIYLLAYSGPKSGYEIASKIYGIEKYPPTSKVYSWTKKMTNELSKTEEGYTSKVDPLLNEIEAILKNNYKIELSDFEKHILGKVLDSQIFRKWIKEITKGLSFEHDVDAVETIMRPVGSMALILDMSSRKFSSKRELPETIQQFDRYWEQLTKRLDGEMVKEGEKIHKQLTKVLKAEKGVKESDLAKFSVRDAERLAVFLVMPDSLLQKLATFSNPVERAIVATLEQVSELPKLFAAKDASKALDKLVRALEKELGE